jgi:hypothetical protein
MTGFIYIWRDKKKNRYYVGSHWGAEDDGYVCSSTWMLQAYEKRPEDFRRRILERFDDRTKINDIEHRWLQMIKPEELKGKRYYNFKNFRFGHWSADENSRLTVKEKISKAGLGRKPNFKNPKARGLKISKTLKERSKKLREETGFGLPIEHRKNIASTQIGHKASEETKKKMSSSRTGMKRSPEAKENIRLGALKREAAKRSIK